MESIIIVTSNDEIKTAIYDGAECISKAVNGYIEHLLATTLTIGNSKVPVDMFCDEEYLYKDNTECSKINAFATIVCQNEVRGNIAIAVSEGLGRTRGFNGDENDTNSECYLAVASLKEFICRHNKAVTELHQKLDKKE